MTHLIEELGPSVKYSTFTEGWPQEFGITDRVWSPAAQQMFGSGTEPVRKAINKMVTWIQAK